MADFTFQTAVRDFQDVEIALRQIKLQLNEKVTIAEEAAADADGPQYILYAAFADLPTSRVLMADAPLALLDTGTEVHVLIDETLLRRRVIAKSADQTIATDATLGADSELKFTTVANTKYRFRLVVWYATVAAADFQWQLSHAGTTTVTKYHEKKFIPGALVIDPGPPRTAFSVAVAMAGIAPGDGWLEIEGYVDVGASGGVLAFEWAQNTSDAGNTTVYKGSTLEYEIVT